MGYLPLIVGRLQERPIDRSMRPTRREGVVLRQCDLDRVRASALIDAGLLALLAGRGHGVLPFLLSN